MFNNNTLGMVRQWQRMFSNERYSETDNYDEVNYQVLASAYGIKSYKAETLQELKNIISETYNLNEPLFIECKINHDCSVYPIVPPGRPIDELLLNG
jgi:acetolactate synthase-1/2/3 large subunit